MFYSIEYLFILLFIPFFIGLFIYARIKRKRAMKLFGDEELLKRLNRNFSKGKRVIKYILLILLTIFFALTLARPQWGSKLQTYKRKGIDIVVLLDLSKSMLAEDIKPNRLEKAKHEINVLIDSLKGDRIAIVVFAGTAFKQCPLTIDYNWAKYVVNSLDVNMMPVPGTDISRALKTANKLFNKEERKYKVMILITDGEGHIGKPVDVAKNLAKEGVIVYTIGVGSPDGVPIPNIAEDGTRNGLKHDKNGNIILSKLDEQTLQKIALETDGKYFRVSAGEMELEKIYSQILSMEKKEMKSKKYTKFEEKYYYPLWLLLILLILELIISERKGKLFHKIIK